MDKKISLSTASSRKKAHPGIKWGPFTFRIPVLHTRLEWPELTQGVAITLSTSMALTPLLMIGFGLSFDEAVTVSLIHYLLVSASPIIFGEPYAGGWITPALPLALAYVMGTFEDPTQRFQAMTALSIDLALILFIFGITGIGSRIIQWMPETLKAGIILGAGLAALQRVFIDDIDKYMSAPVSTSCAIVVCLLLSFSNPFNRFKQHSKLLSNLAKFGLLPGFLVAALIGPIMNEISYDIKPGFLIPPFASLWAKTSPFAIGWPDVNMFLTALPLAFIAYIIVFGDIITGMAIVKEASPHRPDDPIDFNSNRTHFSLAIRNVVMSIFAPFFPSQGCLWAGVHVVIVNRWKDGPDKMQSLYSGISSYYVCGLPILMLFYPWITFLKPLLPIALALTLVLTGIACAGVAMAKSRSSFANGAVFLSAIALATFTPWIGLAIAVLCTWLLAGWENQAMKPE
ncbi:MAG: hypothetical protein H6995_08900 [Pseudomonadales bacterium]|nr:hypothetical protein [Pseudomonadales bacterium]MCP5215111.1 hypothetical protein [Pseudomonadales bacterium]